MAELSLPLKPELKDRFGSYDVHPRDGKLSSLEISKMPVEERARLFETALLGSEAEKRVALALFKKMTNAQMLDTLDKFLTISGNPCCPAGSFYLGALVDQDLSRLKSMYRHEPLSAEEARKEQPDLFILLQKRFFMCTLTTDQSAKLDPILRSWLNWVHEVLKGNPLTGPDAPRK